MQPHCLNRLPLRPRHRPRLGLTVTCDRACRCGRGHIKAGALQLATRNMPLFLQPKSQSVVAATPGDLLLRINDTCRAGVFGSLVLQRYLCPALDALPADQRANLFAILQEAERATADVSSHFGKLDLSGEDSDDDSDTHSDDDGVVDPSKATSVQLAERKRRIEALIIANAFRGASTSEFDGEILSWLPILWHLGVEGATNMGEVLAALQLCDAIRYGRYARGEVPCFRS